METTVNTFRPVSGKDVAIATVNALAGGAHTMFTALAELSQHTGAVIVNKIDKDISVSDAKKHYHNTTDLRLLKLRERLNK